MFFRVIKNCSHFKKVQYYFWLASGEGLSVLKSFQFCVCANTIPGMFCVHLKIGAQTVNYLQTWPLHCIGGGGGEVVVVVVVDVFQSWTYLFWENQCWLLPSRSLSFPPPLPKIFSWPMTFQDGNNIASPKSFWFLTLPILWLTHVLLNIQIEKLISKTKNN